MGNYRVAIMQGLGIADAIWAHPANRGRRLRSVLRFIGWQISKRTLQKPCVINFHGKRLKCFPNSTSTSAALYFNGLADYWEMKFMLAYLKPSDHFIDVGANAGVYSVLAASRTGEDGSIDAFEPMEDMAQRIEEQAKLNNLQNLRVHRVAVGDQSGEMEFGFSSNDAMRHIRRETESLSSGTRVKCIRLDDFQPEKKFSMGKMDIEGAEPLALKGCAARLEQANPPVWLIELAGYSDHYSMTTDQVIALLDSHGYDCAVYDPECSEITYTVQPWMYGVQNVLAISRTHREYVTRRLKQAGLERQS